MSKPIIDRRNEQVYCTNCKHWDKLLKHIEDDAIGKTTPNPCCGCYSYNPEDSVERLIRTKYEEIKNENKGIKVRTYLLHQFDSFDTSIIDEKSYIKIQEKLSNDEDIYLTANKNNEFKIIDDNEVNNIDLVFLVFDTLKHWDINCITCLCIKTKDANIRDIQRENWIVEQILKSRYLR